MGNASHEIDYQILGHDLQYVEITLDPGESVVAEAGGLMFMEQDVEMETIFGDGGAARKGVLGAIVGAGSRLLSGEKLFMTQYTNKGKQRRALGFAAPYPGSVVPLDLQALGGSVIAQKEAFLCAAKGTSLGIAFQKRLGAAFFGGEGFVLQHIQGDGLAFIHAGGMLSEKELKAGEKMQVDTGCLVAFQPSVDYDIRMVSGVKSMIFGGEGAFMTELTGPGKIWVQSLPFGRVLSLISDSVMRRIDKNQK